MPTYDYRCEACGHAFERWQEMSARKLRTCPACKKRKLVRLVGAGAGVIFRGSGFYETDYKRKAPAKAGSSASSSTGDGAASGAGDGAAAGTSTKKPSRKGETKAASAAKTS